jgi:hypothetical protein
VVAVNFKRIDYDHVYLCTSKLININMSMLRLIYIIGKPCLKHGIFMPIYDAFINMI